MIRFMIIMLLITCAISAQNLTRTDRVDEIEVVNVDAGDDSTVMANPRAINVDVSGIVKLKIKPRTGAAAYNVVQYFVGGIWTPIGNVVRVYQYTSGTTPPTAQVYDSTATLVNGIKLGR